VLPGTQKVLNYQHVLNKSTDECMHGVYSSTVCEDSTNTAIVIIGR
jgi:hypothetical protein